MSTKLNNYTLPDVTINLMKSILQKSAETKTELGFTLCADKNNTLQARNICTGEDCTVGILGKCDKQEKFVGAYHTHPTSYAIASASDLIFCGTAHITCIGGERDNKIKCYTWKHKQITEEKYNTLITKLNSGIKEIDDPTYEKNFQCIKEFGPIIRTEKMIREGDKIFHKLSSLIKMAKESNTPKHVIDNMIETLESKLDTRRIIVREMNKNSADLIPKYYDEKIIEE